MSSSKYIRRGLKIATAAAALAIFGAGTSAALGMEAGAGGTAVQQAGSRQGSQPDTRGQRGGQDRPDATGAGQRSLNDILRDLSRPVDRGGMPEDPGGEEDEDSDRPDWAGGGGGRNDRGAPPADAGSTRGDLYGDMWVILRDEDGVPILNADGFVQPIAVDAAAAAALGLVPNADGIYLIPLDEEGAPQTAYASLVSEVDIGRLNVGRSPDSVFDQRTSEVITLLNSATAFTVDAAGRIVVTTADGTKTIDAPLENLALYVAIMTTGTIPGVTDLPGTEYDFLVDGTLTTADMEFAAALMAAAADKASPLSLDAIAYMNAILGISTTTTGEVTYSDIEYADYSYDRSDTYGDVTTTVLVQQPDGTWVPTEVNIYEAVFDSTDFSASATFAAFAQAVEDSRLVINFLHEYALPAPLPTE